VLQPVGKNLTSHVRQGDYVFRIGGDEFAVILMRASVRDAQEVGNRIRESLRLQKDFNQEVPLPVHCSIGIAPLSPKTSTPDTLMEEADRALYEAKETKEAKALGQRI
jgi:diguanylate cyclase